jgi:ubiquinone/menaquinone biosynthesis C-methylase UbiE
MGHPIPDFTSRLRKRISALPGNQKLQMLALCCGTAEKERVLLERVKSNRIELTLVELNEEVLSHVSKKLEPYCTVSLLAADANRLELPQEHYDLIFCAAGLHHLVELEHVVDTISAALRKGGEFWSVGEYIGCSGARLWPEAYDIANPFFSGLPEKYRLSAYTKNVDKVLPNADASVSTYEGIRAPEIEHILAARLRPIHVTKQACFLWRFFDGAYGLNYDLNNSADLDVIRRAVAIDVKHQAEGGRPTSLNGIYSKR